MIDNTKNDKDEFLKTILQIWKDNFPEWRFGQLLFNFFDFFCQNEDPFYWSDEKFISKLNEYIGHINNKESLIKFSKRDLVTGDFVIRRNGNVEFYVKENHIFMTDKSDWNDAEELNDDLTDLTDSEYDIIKVYRPIYPYQSCFKNYMKGDIVFIR